MAAVGVALEAFDDRCELNVAGTNLLIEMIDVERIVRIEIIDHPHGIPFHSMFLQK